MRYRLAANAAQTVVWDRDLLTGKVFWSGSLQGVFGYVAAEAGTTGPASYQWWQEHLHPEDRQRVITSLEAVLKPGGGQSWTSEYRFRRADGTYAWVRDHGYVTRDESGRAGRAISSMNDITDVTVAFEELNMVNQVAQLLT